MNADLVATFAEVQRRHMHKATFNDEWECSCGFKAGYGNDDPSLLEHLAERLAAVLEQVGWGERSSQWVHATLDEGVEVTPAVSFTDDIDPRPEWAEFAVFAIREGQST